MQFKPIRVLAGALAVLFAHSVPAPADAASGLPTGKRQHKPFVVTKSWSAYRPSAARLPDPAQRRAALKLIDALDQAKQKQTRSYDGLHRLNRGRNSRTSPTQHDQTDLTFLRERAARSGRTTANPKKWKGSAASGTGNEVAMEELTLAHEGVKLVETSYRDLRAALGANSACTRACERARRRCRARCHPRRACDCVVRASECLLNHIRAGRCGRR